VRELVTREPTLGVIVDNGRSHARASTVVSFCRTMLRIASDRFGSSRLVGDLEEELQSFVEIRTERHIDHGLSPEVAQRTGFLELGGMEPVKERVRDGRSGASVESFSHGVSFDACPLPNSQPAAIMTCGPAKVLACSKPKPIAPTDLERVFIAL
jgi:hypothetical protein